MGVLSVAKSAAMIQLELQWVHKWVLVMVVKIPQEQLDRQMAKWLVT